MSTSGGYHEYIGGVQYIGGYIDACGGYHDYIGGYHEYIGRYHEYIGRCSVHWGDIMMHVGEQVGKNLSISIENTNVLNIPRCTHDIPPMYSWYPPDVLMVSPQCTEHPPMYS